MDNIMFRKNYTNNKESCDKIINFSKNYANNKESCNKIIKDGLDIFFLNHKDINNKVTYNVIYEYYLTFKLPYTTEDLNELFSNNTAYGHITILLQYLVGEYIFELECDVNDKYQMINRFIIFFQTVYIDKKNITFKEIEYILIKQNTFVNALIKGDIQEENYPEIAILSATSYLLDHNVNLNKVKALDSFISLSKQNRETLFIRRESSSKKRSILTIMEFFQQDGLDDIAIAKKVCIIYERIHSLYQKYNDSKKEIIDIAAIDSTDKLSMAFDAIQNFNNKQLIKLVEYFYDEKTYNTIQNNFIVRNRHTDPIQYIKTQYNLKKTTDTNDLKRKDYENKNKHVDAISKKKQINSSTSTAPCNHH